MALEQWGTYIENKIKFDPYFRPHTKSNLRWITDLDMSSETIRFLKENKGKSLFDLRETNVSKIVNKSNNLKRNKKPPDIFSIIKIKTICSSQDTTKKA